MLGTVATLPAARLRAWCPRHILPPRSCSCRLLRAAAVCLLLLLQVLACIGEQFDEGEEVCGVTVNIRNGKDRLELWSKTAANEALQMSIGKQLKQMLDIPDSNKIGFVVFVSTCAARWVWEVTVLRSQLQSSLQLQLAVHVLHFALLVPGEVLAGIAASILGRQPLVVLPCAPLGCWCSAVHGRPPIVGLTT